MAGVTVDIEWGRITFRIWIGLRVESGNSAHALSVVSRSHRGARAAVRRGPHDTPFTGWNWNYISGVIARPAASIPTRCRVRGAT